MKNLITALSLLMCATHSMHSAQSQTVSYLKAIGTSEEKFDQSSFLRRAYNDRYFGQPLEKYKPLIQKMIKKEKELADTHYVFYHAIQSIYYVIQDMIKEFYLLQKNIKRQDLTHWVPFRIPGSQTFGAYQDVDAFLEHVINTHTEVNDHYPLDSTYLVSANVSIFGNSSPEHVISESSFDIFLRNRGALTKLNPDEIINDVLTHFKIPITYREQFKQLAQNYMQGGALIQIFIPKDLVKKYAYLARNYGKPYGSPNVIGITFDRSNRDKRLSGFWQLLKNNPSAALGSKFDAIDAMLEKYQGDCSKILNYDALSARIIISNDFLLNYNSGVQIFRYNSMEIDNPSALNNYNQKLKDLTKSLM